MSCFTRISLRRKEPVLASSAQEPVAAPVQRSVRSGPKRRAVVATSSPVQQEHIQGVSIPLGADQPMPDATHNTFLGFGPGHAAPASACNPTISLRRKLHEGPDHNRASGEVSFCLI